MEGVMAPIAGLPGECVRLQSRRKTEIMCGRSRSSRRVDVWGSFSDRSHLQYYRGLARCANNIQSQQRKSKPRGGGGAFLSDRKKKKKKKIRFLDGLCKDLSALSNSVADSNGAHGASLADQVRGRILSDALEVVMRQLAQVKAERKERKRQLKAQKKALKARKDEPSSSSSSSSESSDSESECECKVVEVSELCRSNQQQKLMTENYAQFDSHPSLRIPAILTKKSPEGLNLEFGRTADKLGVSKVVAEQQPGGDKIEVCTGPKCKKMGSNQLLEAFEGCGVEAVECKCMGKCRSAPNVRVRKLHGWGSQLQLGVGLGDVDFIVSRHFGGEGEGTEEGDALVSVPA